jgi:very-short-patch-repair endonuclease
MPRQLPPSRASTRVSHKRLRSTCSLQAPRRAALAVQARRMVARVRLNYVLAAAAARQHSVLSRAQLREAGVSRDVVRGNVSAGRWQVLGGNAVVLTNAPLTWHQWCWIAVLHGGPTTAVTGITALSLHGLRGWVRDEVYLACPAEIRPPRLDPIRRCRSRTLTAEDMCELRGLRVCTPARATIDAAIRLDKRSAQGLLAAVVQQQRATPQVLAAALERAGRVRLRAVLHAALADITGGAGALSEIDFLTLCRKARLPTPRLQRRHHEQNGRPRFIDAEFEAANGLTLSVEIDGVGHLDPERWWADHERQNELVITGARMLRFPAPVVRHRPEWVADQIRRALAALSAAA